MTLEESLRQSSDDGARQPLPGTTAPPSGTPSQSGAGSSDASARLSPGRQHDAAQAMRDADAAMSKGDWTAYDEARTRLRRP